MSFPPETSKLDERQIFQSVFDEENRRLRTDATATISNVSIAVDLDPNEDGVYIADKDTGDNLAINPDGSINITDNGGSLTVDASDLDIRNLEFALDKVDVSGSSVEVVSLNDAYIAADVPVSTTQVLLKAGVSILANRKTLILYNRSGANIFIGPSGVNSTTGIRLTTNQMITLNVGPNINIYGITSTGTCNLIVQELA